MPSKKAATPPRSAAKKAGPASKAAAKKAPAPAKKAAPVKKPAAPSAAKTAAKKPAPTAKAAPAKKAPPAPAKAAAKAPSPPAAAPVKKAPRKVVLDKFAIEQREQLQEERASYIRQAEAFKAEADMLALEMEPGDVQFDEESGEGGTANIDRERDLALSAQARAAVEEIDEALARIASGTYGQCAHCGQAIPRPRLKAIPHAALCVACKSGGLSRR